MREGEPGRGRFYIIAATLNKTASSAGGKNPICILDGDRERDAGGKSIEVVDTA